MVEEIGMHSPSFWWLFLTYLIQLRAAQRNPELRAAWAHKMSMYMPNQLIFVDESAANECTSHRKYGWSPKGVRPHENIPFERSERWSVLPAYTVNGFLTWDIEHGSFLQELFEDFIENKLLPFCNPFPGPRSVIIMDNAPIYQSEVYQDARTLLICSGFVKFVVLRKLFSNSCPLILQIWTRSRRLLRRWRLGWSGIMSYNRRTMTSPSFLKLRWRIWPIRLVAIFVRLGLFDDDKNSPRIWLYSRFKLQYFMQVSMLSINDVSSLVHAPISSYDPLPSRLVHSGPSNPSTAR